MPQVAGELDGLQPRRVMHRFCRMASPPGLGEAFWANASPVEEWGKSPIEVNIARTKGFLSAVVPAEAFHRMFPNAYASANASPAKLLAIIQKVVGREEADYGVAAPRKRDPAPGEGQLLLQVFGLV